MRSFKVYHVTPRSDDNFSVVSTGARASASDQHSAPYLAAFICDNNRNTRWATGSKWGTPEAMKFPFASWVELDLGSERQISKTSIVDGWDRIQKFTIKYRSDKNKEWKVALDGTKPGGNYQKEFATVKGRYFKLDIHEAMDEPTVWQWQLLKKGGDLSWLYNKEFAISSDDTTVGKWQQCLAVGPGDFKGGTANITTDNLKEFIPKPGQYQVELVNRDDSICEIASVELLYNGQKVVKGMLSVEEKGKVYNINRTAQIVDETVIELKMKLKSENVSTTDAVLLIRTVAN